jgi:hypothetical protein
MTDDPYAPPTAPVGDAAPPVRREFYVVAPRKFLLLFVLTFGLYSIYWFYEHWALHKRYHGRELWPVARAIFQIFFTHALFRAFDERLRREGRRHEWNASLSATVYVILYLANFFSDRVMPDDAALSMLAFIVVASVVLPALPLLAGQRAANRAEGDGEGMSNSELTAANIAWMVVGALLWLLLLIGTYAAIVDMPL